MDNHYSIVKAKEFEEKKYKPYDYLCFLATRESKSISSIIKRELEQNQWKNIKTMEEIEQRIKRLEEVVYSENDIEYYQMLLLFYRAFVGIKKISIINPNISDSDVDNYFIKLGKIYDEINSKWNLQMMQD